MTVTPGPGGFEAARVSLRVVPDVSRFTDETRDALQQAGNAIEAIVGVTVDRAKIASEIREAIAEAQRQVGATSVKIAVSIETADVTAEARTAAAQAKRAAEAAGAAQVSVVAAGDLQSARDAARDVTRAAQAGAGEVRVDAVATGEVDVSNLRPSAPVNVDVSAVADVDSATVAPGVNAEVGATARVTAADTSGIADTTIGVSARITAVDSTGLTPPPVIDVTARVRDVTTPSSATAARSTTASAAPAADAIERARAQLARLQDAAGDIRVSVETDGLPDLERVRLEVERLRAAARRLPIDLEVEGAPELRILLRDLASEVELQIETREAERRAERVRGLVRGIADEAVEISPEVRPDAIFRARRDLASITDLATDIAFNVDAGVFPDLDRVREEVRRLQGAAGRLPIQLELEGAADVRALLADLVRDVELRIDTGDAERRLQRIARLERELDIAVAFSADDDEIQRILRELEAERAPTIDVTTTVDSAPLDRARDDLRRLAAAADSINITLDADGFPDLERARQEIERLRAAAGRLPIDLELEGAANIRAFLRDLQRKVDLQISTRDAEGAIERVARLKAQLDAAIAFGADDAQIRQILGDLNRERVKIGVDIDVDGSASLRALNRDLDNLSRRYRVDIDTGGAAANVSSLGGSLGGLLGNLRSLGLGLTFTQRQFLALFLLVGPLVISLVPLAAVLGQIALTLGGAFVASLQGGVSAIAILGSSIARLTVAYQELSEAQETTVDGVSEAAQRQESAAIRLSRAQVELAKAQRANASAADDAQRIRDDASRAVSDAQRRLAETQADQTTRIVDAELALERAQLNSRRAQERLTRARQDAVDAIDDLNDRLRDSKVSELSAEAAVQRARNQLRDLSRDYRTEGGDFAAAVLELQLAEERLADARLDGLGVERDVQRARERGNSTDGALDAQLALEDALQAEERARRENVRVVQDTAADIADAERSLTRARVSETDERLRADDLIAESALRLQENILGIAAAEAALATARGQSNANSPTKTYDDLSASAKGLVDQILAQTPRLKDFRREVEEAFFAPLSDPFGGLFSSTLDTLETQLPPLARAIGQSVAAFAEAFSTPEAQGALGASIGAVTSTVTSTTPLLTKFADAFVRIVESAAPFLPLLIQEVIRLGEGFADFITGASDEDLDSFFQGGLEGFRTLRQIVEESASIVKTLFVDTNAEGQNLLTVIADLIADLDEFLKTPEGKEEVIDLFRDSVFAAIQFLFVLPQVLGFLLKIISVTAVVGTVGIQAWALIGSTIDNLVLRPLGIVVGALETIYDLFVLLARVGNDFGTILARVLRGQDASDIGGGTKAALENLRSAFAGSGDAADFFGFDDLTPVFNPAFGVPERSAENERRRQEQLDYLRQLRTLSSQSLAAPAGTSAFNTALDSTADTADVARRSLSDAADAIRDTGANSPEANARLELFRQRLASSAAAAGGVEGILGVTGPVLTDFGGQAQNAAGGVDALSIALSGVSGLVGSGLTVDPAAIFASTSDLVSTIIAAVVADSPRAALAGAALAYQVLVGFSSVGRDERAGPPGARLLAEIFLGLTGETARATLALAGSSMASGVLAGLSSDAALGQVSERAEAFIGALTGALIGQAGGQGQLAGLIFTGNVTFGLTAEAALAQIEQAAGRLAGAIGEALAPELRDAGIVAARSAVRALTAGLTATEATSGMDAAAAVLARRFGDQLRESLSAQADNAGRVAVGSLSSAIAAATEGARVDFSLNQIFGGSLIQDSYGYGNRVGVNIIQGLIDAFADPRNRANLGATVRGLVRTSITDYFGNSPAVKGPLSGSGWTETRGRNIALGLASGLEAGAGSVDAAARRAAALAALDGTISRRASQSAGTAQSTLSSETLDGMQWSLEIDPVGFAKIAARGDSVRRRR